MVDDDRDELNQRDAYRPNTQQLAEGTTAELAAELHATAERLHVIARTLGWREKRAALREAGG